MEGDLETYAPRSPDLSGEIDEPHPQHREYRGSVSHISPFTPTDAKPSPFTFPPTSAQLLNLTPLQGHPPPVFEQNTTSPPFNPYFGNTYTTPEHQQQSVYAQGMVKQEPEEYGDESGDYQPESSSKPPRAKKMKKEEDMGENHAPGVQEGIEVRTKFPVARIKRIMQADEDVGKVAQVTPVVVSKALELFMISLVSKAADQARSRGSKRVLGAHLKQAVLEDEQFDFLHEIVNKVPDAPAKGADKNEDSDEAMEGVAAPKKKRAAARKKRKAGDD